MLVELLLELLDAVVCVLLFSFDSAIDFTGLNVKPITIARTTATLFVNILEFSIALSPLIIDNCSLFAVSSRHNTVSSLCNKKQLLKHEEIHARHWHRRSGKSIFTRDVFFWIQLLYGGAEVQHTRSILILQRLRDY